MKGNTYYNQLKTHVLEKLNVGEWEAFIIYNPEYGKGLMGVTIIFTPEGIVINGDYAPGN